MFANLELGTVGTVYVATTGIAGFPTMANGLPQLTNTSLGNHSLQTHCSKM